MGEYDSTTIVDANTLRITLKEGNPLFLDVLFTPYFTIGHPRHLTEPELEAGNMEVAPLDVGMMGLGPFVFQSYDKGSVMHVTANPDYWETDEDGFALPYMEGMDFAIMTSPDVMDAAIRDRPAGRRLARVRLHPDQAAVRAVRRGPRRRLLRRQGPVRLRHRQRRWSGLEPPQGRPVAGRPRPQGRLALDRPPAVHRRSCRRVRPDRRSAQPDEPVLEAPTSWTWPGWNPDTKEADRAEALSLMEEAGYADGFEVNLQLSLHGSVAQPL